MPHLSLKVQHAGHGMLSRTWERDSHGNKDIFHFQLQREWIVSECYGFLICSDLNGTFRDNQAHHLTQRRYHYVYISFSWLLAKLPPKNVSIWCAYPCDMQFTSFQFFIHDLNYSTSFLKHECHRVFAVRHHKYLPQHLKNLTWNKLFFCLGRQSSVG